MGKYAHMGLLIAQAEFMRMRKICKNRRMFQFPPKFQ